MTELTHAHFLQRIMEDENPEMSQLIYADWLEEQGDPRCEMVRLAVAVRRHPRSVVHRDGTGWDTAAALNRVMHQLEPDFWHKKEWDDHSDWLTAALIPAMRVWSVPHEWEWWSRSYYRPQLQQ